MFSMRGLLISEERQREVSLGNCGWDGIHVRLRENVPQENLEIWRVCRTLQ